MSFRAECLFGGECHECLLGVSVILGLGARLDSSFSFDVCIIAFCGFCGKQECP